MSEKQSILDLKWSREAQQKRGGKTQTALLDATESLILEEGPDGFSMQDVARKAGSSIGSLYHHFKDKEALNNALFARMVRELELTYEAALDPQRWQDAGILDVIRGFTHASFHPQDETANPHIAGKLSAGSDPELVHMHNMVRKRFFDGLRELLLSRREDIGHPEPEMAIAVVLDLVGPLWRSWRIPEEQEMLMCRDRPGELEDEVVSLAAAYLRISDA